LSQGYRRVKNALTWPKAKHIVRVLIRRGVTLGAAGVIAVLAAWELLSRAELLPRQAFPPITVIGAALAAGIPTADFWKDVLQTLIGWAIGLGISAVAAVTLGIVIGSWRTAYRMARPLIEFARPIPSVALIPLAVLVYGTGLNTKLFLVIFASFWPILLQTIYGVQDVDPIAVDTARSFGFGPVKRLYLVTLPSAAPYIATGLRISSSVALILAVTAELVVGAPGIGKTINAAQSGGSYALMYGLIAVAGVLGLVLDQTFRGVERRLLHWHTSQRREVAA
jgi:ABC-type nitrate/sulfonate/bicarbonate transport system permease component